MDDNSETNTFPGRFESLAKISEVVAQAAKKAGLDERATYAVQMAVDEACSNIIEHGYGGEDRGDIECTCRIEEEQLTVILRDEGKTFDPTCVAPPDLSVDLEEREAGGLGIYFMHQLMDEVSFACSPEDGNVLTMVKRGDPSP